MIYTNQDEEFNYYCDLITGQTILKCRRDPYIGCTHRIIQAVKVKYMLEVKIKAISEQVGISKYKVKKIIDFLEDAQRTDPILQIYDF